MYILKGIGTVLLVILKMLGTIAIWLFKAAWQIIQLCIEVFFIILQIVLGIIGSASQM